MTARDIQVALIRERYSRNLCMPNYTPSGWFECDVFELTPADYFHEYEIKLTASDFRAESRKRKSWTIINNEWVPHGPKKLDLLDGQHVKGPTKFYYVYPSGMLPESEIPVWAGIVTVTETEWGIRTNTARIAPQLHRSKVLPEVRRHAHGVCYWRFMKLFLKDKSC